MAKSVCNGSGEIKAAYLVEKCRECDTVLWPDPKCAACKGKGFTKVVSEISLIKKTEQPPQE